MGQGSESIETAAEVVKNKEKSLDNLWFPLEQDGNRIDKETRSNNAQ